MRLGTVQPAFAVQTARTDGDLRLNNVIPGAQGVVLGIQKGQHPLFLIIAQKIPQHRRGGAQHAQYRGNQTPGYAG